MAETYHEKGATFDDVSIQVTSYKKISKHVIIGLRSFKLVNFARAARGLVSQISTSACL